MLFCKSSQRCFAENTVTVRYRTVQHFYLAFLQPLAYRAEMLLPQSWHDNWRITVKYKKYLLLLLFVPKSICPKSTCAHCVQLMYVWLVSFWIVSGTDTPNQTMSTLLVWFNKKKKINALKKPIHKKYIP